ncbi:MAPEG family protein [Arsenicitalea aurantiaca]|uniref:MAPEG family protein n=1 Tax=Arsenicitalea aurantiaca TaxID=1783274 RepID=A0A433X3C4_9HYPH|nr:MAPEG family protein [Arsenicitalea aurantiaca]RUT28556.1 MAPEG family protein [Arsenicitalea aurantiaca]
MSAATLWLIGAALAQGLLAFVILWVMGSVRLPLIARGKVSVAKIALDKGAWPENAQKLSNAFDNQFQLPVLFYVAVMIALHLGAGALEAVLAWAFVGSRIVHAFIHTTTNQVFQRFWAFIAGMAILFCLWVVLIVRLILIAIAGPA